MRETKFRAWDKTRNIYGEVLSLSFPCGEYDANFLEHKGKLQLYNPKNEIDCGFWGIWIEKAELEQFTGLRDKNGKEIYEGDVVKYETADEKAIAVVSCYYGNNFYFCWQNIPDVPTNTDIFGCKEELEVIGNIHENPELLSR